MENRLRQERASRFLARGSLALAAVYPALYLSVAALRLRYPFELEWEEGGSLQHVQRVLAGLPLYRPPSLDFIPFFYTPLYSYAGACAAALLGPGFAPLRLVSILASLGCFGLILTLVRRETGSLRAGVLALGLFAATYRLCGAWLDLARVDSLFLLGLLLAAYFARFGSSARSAIGAGASCSLAFWTKQSALPAILFLALYMVLERRRHAAVFLGALFVLIGLGTLVFDRASGGWLSYYVFVLSSRHPVVPRVFLAFWLRDLIRPLPVAVLLAAAFLLLEGLESQPRIRFHVLNSSGFLAVAVISRMNVGGYDNVLLPACAVLAVLFGLGMHAAQRAVSRTGPRARVLDVLLHGACALQLLALAYNPLAQLPGRRDREAGERLVGALASVGGDVFLPGQPYLLPLAGKRQQAHFAGTNDILAHGTPEVKERLLAELRQRMKAQSFSLLILDSPEWFREEVKTSYRPCGPAFSDRDVFWPVTGARMRPEVVYVPGEAKRCDPLIAPIP